MQFLAPGLLWALAALAIPILLHLFYFRRFRKVEFTNVRFLREVKDETQNRSRLRNLLVLALRLLAFAALVLAFAQPFFGSEAAPSERQTAKIYIDNSFSMSAQSSDVALVDKAKQRAREIVRSYGETAQFQVLTNELDGASGRLVTADDALARIDEVAVSAQSRTGDAIVSRMAPRATGDGEASAYLISDFQRAQFGATPFQDTGVDLSLVPVSAVVQQNVSVDSVWLASPVAIVNEPVVLLAKLTNHGTETADAVRLSDPSIIIDGVNDLPLGETGRTRGNANDNDAYASLSVSLVYYFGDLRCPDYSRR